MSAHHNRSGAAFASAAPNLESSKPSRLWWLYLAYLVGMVVVGIAPYLAAVRRAELSGPLLVLPLLATLLNLAWIVGLWAYIQSRRLAWSGFWQAVLGLMVIQWIYSGICFLRALQFGVDGPQGTTTLIGLGSLVLWIPGFVALWRYAFLSPRVWRR